MYLSNFVLFASLSFVGAWEAGFWSTDGRNIQAHGNSEGILAKCINLKTPLPLGQVTFDAHSGKTCSRCPDPSAIAVYGGRDCEKSTIMYSGNTNRVGQNVWTPGIARSYKVL
ncbi:hypothetical protein NA57DRAFT_77907 [Rhizodiscina lignyota]|uniref:Uncharacterized protein n=1 Tax=Rhizodiscina lignyota TaxID=1504668 RepID=A0A9P4I9V0_9PEZI|nr:hypothetical protein NA57DRAFT_77907 [Rhizodiscina lignyota]